MGAVIGFEYVMQVLALVALAAHWAILWNKWSGAPISSTRFTSSSLTRSAWSLGHRGVELNAVSSFGRMTGPGLVSTDPLAPMPDPSALSDVESVSLSNPTSLSDAELVSSSDPPSLSDTELPCLSDMESDCSSSWQRRLDDKLSFLVIIVVGNVRKGVITFISRVAMIDGWLMVEEIVIIVIIIITFDGTEFTPLDSGMFLGWIQRA